MADATLTPRRPSVPAIVAGQTVYALRDVLRTPVAAFFTVGLPVLFVALIGMIVGDATVDGSGGVRVAQFAVPGLLAWAVASATFSTPAIGMAIAREQGILKRLRGTPLPAWAYLAGRMASATAIAFLAIVLMLAVAVLGFGVEVYARSLPQAVPTLLVAAAAFSAMAFAAVAVLPGSAVVQAVTVGAITMLGFVSDVFLIGGSMPGWLQAIGDAFPLKPLASLLRDAFHPFDSPPFAWGDLAVVVAWGVAGASVAVWRFSWQPATARAPRAAVEAEPAAAPSTAGQTVVHAGPPSWPALVVGQARSATLALVRDASSVFFAVLFPLLLVLLLPLVFGTDAPDGSDAPFVQLLAPAMVAYGAAVHAFANAPEQIARSRDAGVLKRLRGTPLPPAAYLAGRLVSVLLTALLLGAVVLAAAAVVWDAAIPAARLPVAALVIVLGTTAMALLGMLLAALVPTARALPPVTLGLLLPMAFVSGVFAFGTLPQALQIVGWAFPLKPFVTALQQSLDPAASPWAWPALGALLGWAVLAALLALRAFRWEGRRPATPKEQPDRPV